MCWICKDISLERWTLRLKVANLMWKSKVGRGWLRYIVTKFCLYLPVPETYPFNPPKIKFVTRIWHPNICKQQYHCSRHVGNLFWSCFPPFFFVASVTGAICLDILKDQWAAAMTLRTVLLSIQALLACTLANLLPHLRVLSISIANSFIFYLFSFHSFQCPSQTTHKMRWLRDNSKIIRIFTARQPATGRTTLPLISRPRWGTYSRLMKVSCCILYFVYCQPLFTRSLHPQLVSSKW